MSNILRISLLTGLCASLFIPFIVINDFFFPFITGKGFAFRILIELLFALWIVLALIDPAYRPKRSWILYSMSAFVGVIALADIFGANFFRSFWSNFERMEGLVTLFHLYAYMLMLGTVLSTERWWKYFFNTALGANAILCLFYGLPQLHGGAAIHQSSNRLDASLGNATYFAAYLLMHIFIALFLLMRSGKVYERVLYALSIALQIYLMYFTQTRGALLGLIGGLGVVALLIALFERERKTVRKFAWGGIGVLVVFVFGFLLIKDTAFVQKSPTLIRFAQISLSENFLKSQGRYYVWPMAIKGFQERPILGWGQENFNYVFNKNYDPRMWGQEQWFDRTHNVVLDWLIAGGLLGLLSYLSIFVAILYYIWKGKGGVLSVTDKSILTGAIAAYFFQNIFVFDNLTSYMLFLMIVAYVYSTRTPKEASPVISSRPMTISPALYVVVAVLIVMLCGVMYMVNIKPIRANMALLDAVAPEANGQANYMNDIASFKKSIELDTFGTSEAREHLVLLSQRINDPKIPEDVRRAAFEFAVTEMRKQIDTNPEPDARYYLFMGSLLSRYGLLDQALVDLQKALELSPRKQSILIEIGNLYLVQRKLSEAFAAYKQAYDLAPEFIEARLLYALGATEIGDSKLAKELLSGIDIQSILFDERALSLFVQAKQFDTAIEILKKRIETDPKNPQFVLSLAAAYLQKNDRTNAIHALEDFIALDPVQFKAQGEYYINEIRAGRNP